MDFRNGIDGEEITDPPALETIGFWSNWSGDYTLGGQENTLGKTLPDAGGIELGDLTVTK